MLLFLFLTQLLSGLADWSSAAAASAPRTNEARNGAAAYGPTSLRCRVAMDPGSNAVPVFTADAPAGSESAPEAVQQRRSQFVRLIKMGVFERFDDSRQEVLLKHNDPSPAVHDPGPLEDEAIAAAARDALAVEYAKIKLKPHLSCKRGQITIGSLPDDPIKAAAAVDAVLMLDGVQTVTASLPLCLRVP